METTQQNVRNTQTTQGTVVSLFLTHLLTPLLFCSALFGKTFLWGWAIPNQRMRTLIWDHANKRTKTANAVKAQSLQGKPCSQTTVRLSDPAQKAKEQVFSLVRQENRDPCHRKERGDHGKAFLHKGHPFGRCGRTGVTGRSLDRHKSGTPYLLVAKTIDALRVRPLGIKKSRHKATYAHISNT